MRYLRQLFVASILTFAVMPAGCVADAPDDAEQASDVGSLRLALTGTSASGATYRLSNAWFDVYGPTARSLYTSDDSPVLTEVLPAGAYDVTLHPGWLLERRTESGYQRVTAVLTSPNPASVLIGEGATSTVVFQFQADGDVVSVGEGTLDILIGIDETTGPREDTAAACGNGLDDDADGLADCADPECQQQPSCAPSGFIIESFEDGDFHGAVPYASSSPPFTGSWGVFSDMTVPFVEELPVPGRDSPTALGLHSPAIPSDWGAGVLLYFDAGPVDMSGFQGVRFSIRSRSTPVRFEVGTRNTIPGGLECMNCLDNHGVDLVAPEWVTVEVPWSALYQQGSGAPAPFDPWAVVGLIWRTPAGQPAHLEIDDIGLF